MGRVGQIPPCFPHGGVHAGRTSVPPFVGTSRHGPRPSPTQSRAVEAPRTHPTSVGLGPLPPSPHASAVHSGGVSAHGLVQSKPAPSGPDVHAAFVSARPRRVPHWRVSGTPVGHDEATPPAQVAIASGMHRSSVPASTGRHARPTAGLGGAAVQACEPLPEQSNAICPLLHASVDPEHAEGGPPSAQAVAPPTPHVPPALVGLHASPQSAQFSA